jgi:Tfp pilus assembly protein PilF
MLMKAMIGLFAFACATACNEGNKTPPPEHKAVEKQAPEPAKPAEVPVTTSSPDAQKEFELGRDLVDHTLGDEAKPHLQKAVELDPDFAQAHAYLGTVTAGAESTEHLTKATALLASLPEAEQQLITGMLALRAGDAVKAKDAYTKVLALAPTAWRADVALANLANAQGDNHEAIRRLMHALSVKPDLAVAYNGLAYARAGLFEWKPAIAAATKQVELMPKQPNPHDTLGEILLRAGKFDEGEKEFQAALALQPRFTLAWQGIALARGYRGDFKGAHDAIAKRVAVGLGIGDKLDALLDDAWISLAEDKLAAALATLDAIDRDPDAKASPLFAFTSLDRAEILTAAGKYADAAKAHATTQARAEQLTGDAKNEVLVRLRIARLRNAALSRKPAPDADKLLAAFDEDLKTAGNDGKLRSRAAHARGLAAWAHQDLAGAIASLQKCDLVLSLCRFDLASVQRKSGDKAGAVATEQQLRATPRREAPTVYLLAHLPKQP